MTTNIEKSPYGHCMGKFYLPTDYVEKARADEEIIVLDSIGSPALSFAVPAALRLLSAQIERARQQKPALHIVKKDAHERTALRLRGDTDRSNVPADRDLAE